jgi:hypothetical protein
VSDFFKDFDLAMSPASVRKLYQAHPGEDGLTFSQLVGRTEDYFATLDGNDLDQGPSRNLELKGVYLGCRAQPKASGGRENKDLLVHHDALSQRSGRSDAKEEDQTIWKARWTDKTFDRKPRRRCGNNILATVAENSTKMYNGNGAILQWHDKETYQDHPLHRSASFHQDSARSSRSTVPDSSRTLETSRSTTSILTTPWATDRDLH